MILFPNYQIHSHEALSSAERSDRSALPKAGEERWCEEGAIHIPHPQPPSRPRFLLHRRTLEWRAVLVAKESRCLKIATKE